LLNFLRLSLALHRACSRDTMGTHNGSIAAMLRGQHLLWLPMALSAHLQSVPGPGGKRVDLPPFCSFESVGRGGGGGTVSSPPAAPKTAPLIVSHRSTPPWHSPTRVIISGTYMGSCIYALPSFWPHGEEETKGTLCPPHTHPLGVVFL